MMPLFFAFYDMPAVMFVLPDEMAYGRGTAVVYSYSPIKLNPVSHSHSKRFNPIYIKKKNIGFGTRTTQPAPILQITGKAVVHL